MKTATTVLLVLGSATGCAALSVPDPLPSGPAAWGLATLADCEAPDGRTFTTEVVSLPDGTVRFVQVHPARRTEMVVLPATDGEAAERVFRRQATSGAWERVDDDLASFVHGHDAHRLFLRARLDSGEPSEELTRTSPPCLGGGEVTIRFDEARDVLGFALPYAVEFLHAGESHRYRFRSVLPFRLAPSTSLPSTPDVAFERLGDLHEVVAIHERAMQAHRDGDVETLVADQAEAGILAGRGRLRGTSPARTRERLGPYLASSTFERYADTVAPVVAVADDGSLAWLACEMEARGVRRDEEGAEESLEFAYTWVELLARHDGRWQRIGNASSARD